MTQEDVAKKLFISRQHYSHFENGNRVPDLEMLIRMSTLFHLSPYELIFPLIPRDVALTNPEILSHLKNGMSIFKDFAEGSYTEHDLFDPKIKHTAAMFNLTPNSHPELR